MVKTKNLEKHGRKVLQTLQPSINDESLLVGSTGSVSLKLPIEKKVLQPATTKIISQQSVDESTCDNMSKENGSPQIVRRSQRKRVEIIPGASIESPVPLNSVSKSTKKKNSSEKVIKNTKSRKTTKKVATTKKFVNQKDDVLQSKIDVVSGSSSDKSADILSLSPDLMYLVNDETPEHYWKELAEERQAALEETLRENESLRDQLTVLQAENELLLSVVDSARELATFLVQNIDEDAVPLSKEELDSLFNISSTTTKSLEN